MFSICDINGNSTHPTINASFFTGREFPGALGRLFAGDFLGGFGGSLWLKYTGTAFSFSFFLSKGTNVVSPFITKVSPSIKSSFLKCNSHNRWVGFMRQPRRDILDSHIFIISWKIKKSVNFLPWRFSAKRPYFFSKVFKKKLPFLGTLKNVLLYSFKQRGLWPPKNERFLKTSYQKYDFYEALFCKWRHFTYPQF